ncbi:MAG: sulfotransferase [Pseudomonadota bacterium]|nr:sulfotransferase [Pseudomonadota bacterium]
MSDKAAAPVVYRNLASRLLLSRQWKSQHAVPAGEPPSARLMKLLSHSLLKADTRGIEIEAPVFIIGTPRCGSTMMMQLLATNERIAYFTHTMNMFRDPRTFYAVEWLRRKLRLDVRGERYLRDSVYVDGSSPSEAMGFWGEALDMDPCTLSRSPRRIDDFAPERIDWIRDSIRQVIACSRERGARRFLSKCPALLTEVLLLQDIFPDARFIYLVRDGRMVANSLLKLFRRQREQDIKVAHPLFREQPFVPYPRVPALEQAADEYGLDDLRTTATVWDDSVKLMNQLRPQLKHCYEVRYEDVLHNPREQMRLIHEFCKLPLPNNEAYRQQIAQVGVIHHSNRYGGFDVVESIADDSLRQYGYL